MPYAEDANQVNALIRQICDVRYSDLELERECCEQLLELGTRKNNAYAICYAHTYLGDYHYASGNFVDSEQHLISAREYCALHGFEDLLLDNYLFSGHLFNRIGNEQRTLDFYLDGVALAERLNNTAMASALYGSIAAVFHMFGDYAGAMHCLETAYERQGRYDANGTVLRRHINLLANLSVVACQLDRYEEGKLYLRQAEELIASSKLDIIEFGIIYIAKVCCVEANQPEALQAVLDELFSLKPEQWLDKSLVYDMFISIANRLLQIKAYTCLQQVLDILRRACEGTEYAHSLTLHSLYIHFWQTGHSKLESSELYREFYAAYTYGDAISQEVRSAGLMAKMTLRRTIEEKEAAQARNEVLEEVAYNDELTQTYIRRYLSDFIKNMRKNEIPRQISVGMIDLDYFKEYNDTYGHMAGDNALRAVARCLMDFAPPETFVVRYGGDEFLSVSFDQTAENMDAYFHRVRAALTEQALEHKNSRCPVKLVSLSIGYCSALAESAAEVELLFSRADKALYISKYKGRNTVTRYEAKAVGEAPAADSV